MTVKEENSGCGCIVALCILIVAIASNAYLLNKVIHQWQLVNDLNVRVEHLEKLNHVEPQ